MSIMPTQWVRKINPTSIQQLNDLELLVKKKNLKQALIFLLTKHSQDTQKQNSQPESESNVFIADSLKSALCVRQKGCNYPVWFTQRTVLSNNLEQKDKPVNELLKHNK